MKLATIPTSKLIRSGVRQNDLHCLLGMLVDQCVRFGRLLDRNPMADERAQLQTGQQIPRQRQPALVRPARLQRGIDRRDLRADDSQPPAVEGAAEPELNWLRTVPGA